MKPIRSDGKVWLLMAVIIGLAIILASVLLVLGSRYRNRPLSLTGAIVQQDADPRKQTPIDEVEVTAAGGLGVEPVRSSLAGFFKLVLRPGIRRGQVVTLQFRHPKYMPLNFNTVVGDNLYVIHLTPLPSNVDVPADRPEAAVTNVLVRYSIETSAEVNIGTGVKTFQVPNTSDVPCEPHGLCSPDGKWKAAIASASLDAGPGNVFEDARVFCIAGPCPFTRIESDGFSRGGRNISVSVRDWSDTTTFLFEAEVFREQVSDIVRQSYPVIFGRTFNFSLPAAAEGPSLEAELGGSAITFPLGPSPNPNLTWAACTVILGREHSKIYRCELKSGFKF